MNQLRQMKILDLEKGIWRENINHIPHKTRHFNAHHNASSNERVKLVFFFRKKTHSKIQKKTGKSDNLKVWLWHCYNMVEMGCKNKSIGRRTQILNTAIYVYYYKPDNATMI